MNTDNDTPWEVYQRPFVKDLAYAIACPDILKEWIPVNSNYVSPTIKVHDTAFWRQQFSNYTERLNELDNTKAYKQLTRFLMSRPSPYRLGFHFEGLIHFWLEDGYQLGLHPYQVIAHNVQLYNGKQTKGELDFVIRNHDTGEVEHWELAIKFYIGSPPFDFKNWVGINSRDNLSRKMTHMQTKSFGSINVDINFHETVKIDQRYAVMKGRFFYPSALLNGQTTKNSILDNRPDWLNDSFPFHCWHQVNNESDFRALKMPNLRPAHYIEWLTYRPFYDATFLTEHSNLTHHSSDPVILELELAATTTSDLVSPHRHLSKEEQNLRRQRLRHWPHVPLSFDDIDTNLYINEGEPVVLKVNKTAN